MTFNTECKNRGVRGFSTTGGDGHFRTSGDDIHVVVHNEQEGGNACDLSGRKQMVVVRAKEATRAGPLP